MKTLILLISLILLAVINIFIYRKISINTEVYARWYLEDFPSLDDYFDKLVNVKKLSIKDALILKKIIMKKINRNLSFARYADIFVWFLIILLILSITTISILKHCLFFSKVFLYSEIAIVVLIFVSYILAVLSIRSLGLKVIKNVNLSNKNQEIFEPVIIYQFMIELGLELIKNKEALEKIIDTISLIRKDFSGMGNINICDNLTIGNYDYRLTYNGEIVFARTFADGLSEKNIDQIRIDIIKTFNEKIL